MITEYGQHTSTMYARHAEYGRVPPRPYDKPESGAGVLKKGRLVSPLGVGTPPKELECVDWARY